MLTMKGQSPERETVWLFGASQGVQVWRIDEHRRIEASILVGPQPIVLLNNSVVGTAREGDALSWALARVHEAVPGFYVRMAERNAQGDDVPQ
jgi:hypothetical protein